MWEQGYGAHFYSIYIFQPCLACFSFIITPLLVATFIPLLGSHISNSCKKKNICPLCLLHLLNPSLCRLFQTLPSFISFYLFFPSHSLSPFSPLNTYLLPSSSALSSLLQLVLLLMNYTFTKMYSKSAAFAHLTGFMYGYILFPWVDFGPLRLCLSSVASRLIWIFISPEYVIVCIWGWESLWLLHLRLFNKKWS